AHVVWTLMMFALMLFPMVWYMSVAWQMKEAAYKKQAVVMTLASILFFLGGNLSAFRSVTGIPFPLGFTFAAVTLSSAILCYALLRMGWLDILPIALKEVFHDAPDSILVLNTDLNLVEANRAASILLPSLRAGEPVDLPGADLSKILNPGSEESPPDSGSELKLRGSVYWVRTLPITHKLERAGFLLILTDITLRKRAEEEKEKLIGQLQEVGSRLEESNRELEGFAFTASHDLQEPLRKILLFSDRLKGKYGEQIGEQGRDYLERMQNAAVRMQSLIDGLLTLSKVTSSARAPVPVNLSEAAKEALSDLEPRIEQAGGRVQIEDLPTIEGDPLQLSLLMQNLIGNAVKFRSPSRPPVVRVFSLSEHEDSRLPRGLAGEAVCRIAVQDNGIGFDERHADRIFGIFERLESRSQYDGAGIGLATCRKIAERHGGGITAPPPLGARAQYINTPPNRGGAWGSVFGSRG